MHWSLSEAGWAGIGGGQGPSRQAKRVAEWPEEVNQEMWAK